MNHNQVLIFDTTLRDGEQVPGSQLNTIEKIEVAKSLEALGVDIIEAGFPISSPEDFRSVQEISKAITRPIICPLSRAIDKDIKAAADSLEFATHKRIHTFISSSDIHIKTQFNSTREKILEQGINAVKYALTFVDDVEFSAMDATRSDKDFLVKFVTEAIRAGAKTINIPDTVGYSLPDEYGQLITYLFQNVPNINQAVISVHCHNDLGLATANTLAGVRAGARQVEVTVNGVGERAGNTSLEETVMILKTHQLKNNLTIEQFDNSTVISPKKSQTLFTNIQTEKITQTSRLISRLLRVPIQPNKAIVGRNAFAHSSGIHQHGILKNRENYEIMNPVDVGLSESGIELTARSGRAALNHRLKKLGYTPDQTQLDTLYDQFLILADRKKTITNEDLSLLMGDRVGDTAIKLEFLQVLSGNPLQPMATVKLHINGKTQTAAATGNGPVDAVFKAIDLLTGHTVILQEYLVQALHGGSDDLGKVHVQIEHAQNLYYGFGADTDIIVASAKAYIDALNKIDKINTIT